MTHGLQDAHGPIFGRRDPDARGYFGAVRRPLRARDAGRADRGADRRLFLGARRRRASAPSSSGCCATTSAVRRRSTKRRRLHARPPAARASSSSARTSRTPARTRSTTRSARRCSPCAWASGASSPKPAPASTASRRRRRARCSASSASSTWARRTWRGRRSTCSACGCSARRSIEVDAGSRTLKDAINEAMRDWVTNVDDTYYLLGSVLGPHPYPLMVREFQSVIGREARAQMSRRSSAACPTSSSPASAAAATPWASSTRSSTTRGVRLIGVEAGGRGDRAGQHAARFAGGSAGVLQGTRSFVLQDADGNIELTHSISAGLDYAAVGPEHAWLRESGRAEYTWIDDAEALAGVPAPGARQKASCRRSSRRTPSRTPAARADAAAGRDPPRQPVGPRRQGRASASQACAGGGR